MPSFKQSFQILRNMGWRYTNYRISFELKKRLGLFQKQFPKNPQFRSLISLQEWRAQSVKFLLNGRIRLPINSFETATLQQEFDQLTQGTIPFFSSKSLTLGKHYDWITNPDTGFQYDISRHWTQINDYSKEAGDIKYVWEKSRFSFLYTVLRYDAHTGEDHSEWVWNEILSWIKGNPINCGPNYKCSQEISLRVLNWTFALHFYKNSDSLTEEAFQKIIFSIYWQLHHVYHNINFSRIAVRNNHAITETLTLYLGGMLYPFFPEAETWKTKGKKWFEEEIAYQVYEDGTFLQFSMNYHRVVVQLLTWGIRLAELNSEKFSEVVYARAERSLLFLLNCMNPKDGWLPNYGANDGALFFKFNDGHYRDFRPQLEALSRALGLPWEYGQFEDVEWYGLNKKQESSTSLKINQGSTGFKNSGYYLFRQENSFTFIRCGSYKDRPSQADNLHLDIWYQGKNIIHDGGSYKYNTDADTIKYFMGTQSHNTVMLDSFDQMEKGSRFIWYHWSQCEKAKVTETENYYQLEGRIKAFQHVNKSIRHYRKVTVFKNKPLWEVEDKIIDKPEEMLVKQLWHTSFLNDLTFQAKVKDGEELTPKIQEGYYSSFYGKKETCTELVFATKRDSIITSISIKE